MSREADTLATVATAAAAAGFMYWLFSGTDKAETVTVSNEAECLEAVKKLRKHCDSDPVLGFDCEADEREPVALLQLCSTKGYCVLIRLCHPSTITDSLRKLLLDRRVVKVGVGAPRDAERLCSNHDIEVESVLDLRFPAILANYTAQNLSDMYKEVMGKTMIRKKHPGSWSAYELNERQVKYAAQGAIASMEIYMFLSTKKLSNPSKLKQYYNTTYVPYRHDQLKGTDSGCVLQ